MDPMDERRDGGVSSWGTGEFRRCTSSGMQNILVLRRSTDEKRNLRRSVHSRRPRMHPHHVVSAPSFPSHREETPLACGIDPASTRGWDACVVTCGATTL